MNGAKRASTGLGAPSKKKKSGNKESKPVVVGDTLAGMLGHESNADYTPLHTEASAFDATAGKEVRNFLLAPSHAAYLNRTWSTSRTLTEEDISNPPKIVPLLYRDTTTNRRPILAMLDNTFLTYVVYGNGYRTMEKNHVLYELCETHGKAMVLGLCAYFGNVEEEKIDLQYRYILASLVDLYGPDLKWYHAKDIYSDTPMNLKIRVLVVDGLSASIKDFLKNTRGIAPESTPLQSLIRYNACISKLAEFSKWTSEPRGVDGHARARYTYDQSMPRHAMPFDASSLENDTGERSSIELTDPKKDEKSVQENDQEDGYIKKKKKRKHHPSSDEEDSLSESGSDVKSESSTEEEDESSKSGSETDDDVNSSDSDDITVSKRAESMMKISKKEFTVEGSKPVSKSNASKLESSSNQLKKDYKHTGPKSKYPSEKKKPDNAGSLRKHATDKLDRVLQMKCLFENSLSKELNREVTSTIDNLQSLSDEYKKEGKVENARALIDAQSELNRVLMKTVTSLCRDNAHRKLAVIMATLYEDESSQFESIAQAMVSMGVQMEAMVKKRIAAGQEAEKVAGDLAKV